MIPDKYTLDERFIAVGGKHKLYSQLWGNKNAAKTIIFLHGGPGSGCSEKNKTLFDPKSHRVIFFDQRGCGNSKPHGLLTDNTTDNIVGDITKIADEYKVNKFTLVGGSWGSCLALVYAIRSPNRVSSMILRGIFTSRQQEIDFIEKGMIKDFFPEIWERFVSNVPKKYQNDPAKYHVSNILGSDVERAKSSAFALSQLEVAVIALDDRESVQDYDLFDPAGTIIEWYYMQNRCFLPEGYIIDNADTIKIPVYIVQGRYDMVCPPFTAYELGQKLPNCKFIWTQAGHSGSDRSNWEVVKTLLSTV